MNEQPSLQEIQQQLDALNAAYHAFDEATQSHHRSLLGPLGYKHDALCQWFADHGMTLGNTGDARGYRLLTKEDEEQRDEQLRKHRS